MNNSKCEVYWVCYQVQTHDNFLSHVRNLRGLGAVGASRCECNDPGNDTGRRNAPRSRSASPYSQSDTTGTHQAVVGLGVISYLAWSFLPRFSEQYFRCTRAQDSSHMLITQHLVINVNTRGGLGAKFPNKIATMEITFHINSQLTISKHVFNTLMVISQTPRALSTPCPSRVYTEVTTPLYPGWPKSSLQPRAKWEASVSQDTA